MKVTLIRPPAYSIGLMGVQRVPVLGVAYVGSYIRQAGHDVDIIDMCGEDVDHTEVLKGKYVQYGMPLKRLETRLKYTDCIGVTCMFSQDWPFHRELIESVRELCPESVIIAGGEHVTALPEYCLEDCPGLDVCIIGEGENIFVQLIDTIKNHGSLDFVTGIAYRNKGTGRPVKTQRAERIKQIDQIPLPAWDLMPVENYLSRGLNYHIKRGRTMPMLGTRGCPYNCTFCSNEGMWGRSWIPRDYKMVVDEMELYIKKYGAQNFVFSDLTAVISRKCIVDLCNEIISRGLGVTWQLPTLRTEAVDFEVLEIMYKAGCRELDFAIESGSKEVLESVNKKNDPQRIFALIKDALRAGMNLSTNIVIGLPEEGWTDFFATYRLLIRLAVAGLHEVNVFPFIPYPGSALFREYVEAGKIELNDEYFYGLFGYADLSKPISWSEHFGPRTLSFMRFVLMSNFYLVMFITHPKRAFSLVSNIFTGRTTTKLEGVLKRVFANVRNSLKGRAGKEKGENRK